MRNFYLRQLVDAKKQEKEQMDKASKKKGSSFGKPNFPGKP